MIYRKKSTAQKAVESSRSGGEIQVNKMVAPSHLNPYIRGLRLAFVLLFCFIDIGYALYLVLLYTFFGSYDRRREPLTFNQG